MHVFVTGGTGLIGTRVVAELIAHGHSAVVLARSDAAAAAVEAAGALALRGDLRDLDTLRDGASRADGVLHLAFSNDFSSAEAILRSVADETAALTVLGEALVGSDRPFVTVSGTPWVPGQVATELDPLPTDGVVGGRGLAVTKVLGLAERGVRSAAVRLPRTVHDQGNGGFAGLLTQLARRTGRSAYPDDGAARWPAVHAADAAALFRIALERAPAGTAWHAVADEGDQVGDIAGVIGRRLGLPAVSVSPDELGPLGPIFATDQPASSTYTRQTLGWEPTHPGLLDDLELLEP